MVFSMGFKFDSYLGGLLIFVFFGAWALLTVGILVLIEGLSPRCGDVMTWSGACGSWSPR